MCNALELQILDFGRQIIEQEDGTFPADEVLFERKDLPAITKRALSKQAQFRERVDDDTFRFDSCNLGQDGLGGDAEFDLGRLKHRTLVVWLKFRLRSNQFQDFDTVE